MTSRILLAALLLPMLCAGLAWGQAAPLVFDEEGHGAFGPGVLAPDPGPAGLPLTLTYHLPYAGLQGDVLLTDADAGGVFLDVIRFNGNGTLVFYSDNVDGIDNLADTINPPATLYANQIMIPEVGPEGNNGAFYTPTPNQPGFDPSFPTYFFQSDTPVPEPSSIALLSLGTGVVGFFGWRRPLFLRLLTRG
jgi:hypothetical protein